MKKIILFIIMMTSFFMLLLAFSSCSENNITDSENLIASSLTYQKKNENGEQYYVVTGAKNKEVVEIVIPSYHNDLIVKEIANSAFEEYAQLKNVYIASTIEKIGNDAFNQAYKLDTISIPENSQLKKIGSQAFRYTAIKNFYFPKTLQEMDDFCFDYCRNLFSVNLEQCNELEVIPDYAFRHCSSLKYVYLSKNIKIIGDGCFNDTACEYVLMYNKVESIGDGFYKGFIITGQWGTGITVMYYGTREEWDLIEFKGYYQYSLYLYSDDYKNQSWHFVDGIPTIW